MVIKTLDQIYAMTGHPDAPYGDVLVSLSALYEEYGEAKEHEKHSNGQHVREWAEHADKVITEILTKAKVVK